MYENPQVLLVLFFFSSPFTVVVWWIPSGFVFTRVGVLSIFRSLFFLHPCLFNIKFWIHKVWTRVANSELSVKVSRGVYPYRKWVLELQEMRFVLLKFKTILCSLRTFFLHYIFSGIERERKTLLIPAGSLSSSYKQKIRNVWFAEGASARHSMTFSFLGPLCILGMKFSDSVRCCYLLGCFLPLTPL